MATSSARRSVAGVLCGDRFLHVRDRSIRRHRAAGLADGRRRRDDDQRRRARHPSSAGRAAARRCARRLADHLRPRASARRRREVPLSIDARDLRGAASRVKGRRRRLRRDHLGTHRSRDGRLLAVPVASNTRARRACTKVADSATPTARRTFSRSTGGPPRKSPTPTTRSC